MDLLPRPSLTFKEDSYLRITYCIIFMTTTVHVFNQYYWDLLKKSKNLAKDLKHKASDTDARTILREIKKSYMTFDKSSEEHIQWYKTHVFHGWRSFAVGKSTIEQWKQWHEADDNVQLLELYKGITMGTLLNTYKSKDVLLYYFMLLAVFADEHVKDEHVSKILEILKKRTPLEEGDLSFMEDEFVATSIRLLHEMSNTTSPSASSSQQNDLLSDLENTTLGKLAKEIMEDVNIAQIQESVGDGDILKAFTDPNGQMTKLIGTVTQKMVSKLASGELRQDTLLSDAMKLAGSLPGGGGGGMLDQLGKMASMFGGGGMDEDGEGFDIASMMKNMMGGGSKSTGKNTRSVVNNAALTRNVKAKQLRRKLEERRKVKENIGTHVGDQ